MQQFLPIHQNTVLTVQRTQAPGDLGWLNSVERFDSVGIESIMQNLIRHDNNANSGYTCVKIVQCIVYKHYSLTNTIYRNKST